MRRARRSFRPWMNPGPSPRRSRPGSPTDILNGTAPARHPAAASGAVRHLSGQHEPVAGGAGGSGRPRPRRAGRPARLPRGAGLGATICATSRRRACSIETMALRLSIEQGGDAWEAGVLAAHHRLSRRPRSENLLVDETWEELHRGYHISLIAACGLPRLIGFCTMLHDHFDRYRRLAVLQGGRHPTLKSSHASHRQGRLGEGYSARRASARRAHPRKHRTIRVTARRGGTRAGLSASAD